MHKLNETASKGFVEIARACFVLLVASLPNESIRLLVLQHMLPSLVSLHVCSFVYSTHQFPIMSQQIVVLRRSGRLEELGPHRRCSKMLRELHIFAGMGVMNT